MFYKSISLGLVLDRDHEQMLLSKCALSVRPACRLGVAPKTILSNTDHRLQ